MSNTHDSRFLENAEFQTLLVACLEQLERGESLDHETLLREHPHFAEPLKDFLADQAMLKEVAAGVRESLGGSPGFSKPDRSYDATIDSSPKADGDFAVGKTIRYVGEYEILEEIARGGMGVVFKARQQKINRVVALKMILAGKLADAGDVERFHREAQAAGRLKHPNIVPVHEVGEHEGRHYFTMDFVDGRSLAEEMREESLPPRRAAQIVRTAAEAVHFAHQRGTLHRDLKPANVLLTDDGAPHITDFGLAKIMDAVDEDTRAELTASGQILGTPSYMSPEQASGKQQLVGPASDIYSLGAVLYACLTGRAPFVADSPVDTLLQVMRNEPVSPRTLNPSVPRDLETICLKCLNKEPHKRYGTPQELSADLGRYLEGRPVVARPVGVVAKTWRWRKRNPWIAGLLALSVLLLVSGTAVSSYFAIEADHRADAEAVQHQRAEAQTRLALIAKSEAEQALLQEAEARKEADIQRVIAEQEQQKANESRRKAERALSNEAAARKLVEQREREARWNEYVARMTVIQRPWEEKEFGQLSRMVEQVRPQPEEPDFRGWEWNYYHDQTEQAAHNLGISEQGQDIDWSADGRLIATAGSTLEIWDAKTGVLMHQANLGRGLSGVAWNPDNQRLALGYGDGSAGVYDMRASRILKQWKAHDLKTWSIDWSPEGDRVATGSLDGGAAIWNAETGELILRLMPNQESNNKNYLRVVDWCPNDELVATTHRDGYVRLFDAQTGDLNFRSKACGISCNVCAWSPDGDTLVAGGAFPNYEIIFYSKSGQRSQGIETHARYGRWSPDGKRFATGGDDHDVTIWNIETKQIERVLRFHFGAIMRLAWSPDSQRLASIADDGTARVWNFDANVPTARTIHAGPASARVVAYSPNGNWIAGVFADKKVRVWRANRGELEHEFEGHSGEVKWLSWASDSTRIVSICGRHDIYVWDLESGEGRNPFCTNLMTVLNWTHSVPSQ